MLSTSVASSVRVDSSRATSSRSFWLRLGLQLRGRRLGRRDGRPGRLLGLGDDGGRLGLALPLGLVDELLGQQQGALQGLVAQRVSFAAAAAAAGCRLARLGGTGAAALLALELRDPLAGLAQPFVELADVLLESLASWAALSRYSSTSSTL